MALYKVILETTYNHEGIIEANNETELNEKISSISTDSLASILIPVEWWAEKDETKTISLKESELLGG